MKVLAKIPSKEVEVEISKLTESQIVYKILSNYIEKILKKYPIDLGNFKIWNFYSVDKDLGKYEYHYEGEHFESTGEATIITIQICDFDDRNKINAALDIYINQINETKNPNLQTQ